MLRDRRVECATLDRLIEAVRTGKSQAVVVRGEPGVGKTVLLDYLVERATGCRVARAAGVQSEMELVFAGLHQLCAPMLDLAERLPDPQRDALVTAFGLSSGPAPDRFLVGLAVLGLFAEAARERPLVCVIDDAQWLDSASAQALAFVARRLVAESVAMVFAARDPEAEAEAETDVEWAGLEQLVVTGLPDGDARALLSSALPGSMDDRLVERLIAETRGNPLALLELPKALTPAELAGGFGLASNSAVPTRIEECFQRQFAPLDVESRRLLLIAATEPFGEPAMVWRAAERLGIGVAAAKPAASAGLLEIGARVQFRHPLVRSAVYHAASPEERQNVHRACRGH